MHQAAQLEQGEQHVCSDFVTRMYFYWVSLSNSQHVVSLLGLVCHACVKDRYVEPEHLYSEYSLLLLPLSLRLRPPSPLCSVTGPESSTGERRSAAQERIILWITILSVL